MLAMPQTLRLRKSSTFCGKKLLEHFGGLTFTNACVNLWTMVAAWAGEDARATFNAAALGIACAVIQSGDSRVCDSGGTHRAGFKRYPQIAVSESLAADLFASCANRDDFGVSGWIMPLSHRIARNREHIIPAHDHSPNRDFALRFGSLRAIKRQAHGFGQKKSHYHRLSARKRLTKAGGLAIAALFIETLIH
jgi:hypothetical protein